MKILILCTGNSCRSQMAHGWVSELTDGVEVFSAGTKPAEKVNPFAIKAMQKFNIDISSNITNHAEEYVEVSFDLVLTVCDKAKETCPVIFNTLELILNHLSKYVGMVNPDDLDSILGCWSN